MKSEKKTERYLKSEHRHWSTLCTGTQELDSSCYLLSFALEGRSLPVYFCCFFSPRIDTVISGCCYGPLDKGKVNIFPAAVLCVRPYYWYIILSV